MREYGKAAVRSYLDELASAAPAPGGGSAAALTLALGLALLEMTARINDKRALAKGARPGPASRVHALARLRRRAERLVTLDARTFLSLSSSFKKPKDSKAFQAALRKAAAPPLEIADLAVRGLELCVREKARTSRWIASDLAESALLLSAAQRAARLNAEVNLRDLADSSRARRESAALAAQTARAAALERQAADIFRV